MSNISPDEIVKVNQFCNKYGIVGLFGPDEIKRIANDEAYAERLATWHADRAREAGQKGLVGFASFADFDDDGATQLLRA